MFEKVLTFEPESTKQFLPQFEPQVVLMLRLPDIYDYFVLYSDILGSKKFICLVICLLHNNYLPFISSSIS